MEIFKKQSTACLIMIVLIVLSVFLGSGNSLRRLTRSADDIFFNGVRGDGIGVAYDMDLNLSLAYNLQTVAGRYLDEKDSDMKHLASSIDAMSTAETLPEMAKGNDAITKNIVSLSEKLLAMDISDADYNYTIGFVRDLNENNSRISKDPYNAAAAQINKDLTSFPASLLRIPAGVKKLPLFT